MANSELEQRSIDTIRTLAMDAVQQANAGHPGTAMALAPLAYLLYREVMHHNPASPHWPDRDRFVLSAGHACILQYTALHLTRLRPLARGAEAVPPVGVAHAGPPRGAPHARHRGDDRAARAGLRERRRLRDRGALPRRALQPAVRRDRRPPRLRDLLGRRPDGGRLERGGLDRGPARPRQARLLLRRQPHHDRRHDVALVLGRGQGRALRGAGLARPARRRRQRPAVASPVHRRGAGRDRAALARSWSGRTSPSARRTRSTPPRPTARRSARRRCARRRRRSAGIPTRRSSCRTTCAST